MKKIYKTTTDYGINIDVDVAPSTAVTPTIQHQCGSFFVGAKGAYIGYSGDPNTKLNTDTQIYRILDSNSIKDDAYIKSLEDRIAALETLVASLIPTTEEETI